MHEYFHTKFGFCMWDVGALILLAAVIVVLVVHVIRQKKRERDLEDELSDQMAQTDPNGGNKQ